MKPVLFEVGSFQLHAFGLLVAMGFLSGTWLAGRRARVAGERAQDQPLVVWQPLRQTPKQRVASVE